jgi:hypothetical protein
MTLISEEAIKSLREKFFTISTSNYDNSVFEYNCIDFILIEDIKDFHNEDLMRLKENDEWIKAFYSKYGKEEETLNSIRDTLKWRQEFGVNSI